MSGAMTLRFTTQAQVDIRRITSELTNMQRQVASGAAHDDLQGFGGAASRLLSAQSLKATADARGSVISQLQARLGMQTAALGQVADAATTLSQSIREAISANDGRGIVTELGLSFSSTITALNESWNGQPLFAGERQSGGPIRIRTLDELVTAVSPDAIFDEASRNQTIDIGTGAPVTISAKASQLSQGLFDAMRELQILLNSSGGTIGQPISASEANALQGLADQLTSEAENFTNEQGRAGQLQNRFETEQVRLTERSNLLEKEIGEQADADVAEVSIKLNALLVQYEAAAKTFAELSKLTLLDYL